MVAESPVQGRVLIQASFVRWFASATKRSQSRLNSHSTAGACAIPHRDSSPATRVGPGGTLQAQRVPFRAFRDGRHKERRQSANPFVCRRRHATGLNGVSEHGPAPGTKPLKKAKWTNCEKQLRQGKQRTVQRKKETINSRKEPRRYRRRAAQTAQRTRLAKSLSETGPVRK